MSILASPSKPTRKSRLLSTTLIVPVLLGLTLAGCVARQSPDLMVTNAVPLDGTDLDAANTYWGQRYQANGEDREAVLNYAAVLMRQQRVTQAVAVLEHGALTFPDDREVMAAYGKALATAGQFNEALNIIRRAQTPDHPDWRLLAAEAAILDQQGDNQTSRVLLAQAIELAPGEASLWSNLGMSYVLTGDLVSAEQYLSHAVELPTADSRVRQNLALVLGLMGRFDEAEAIARRELSPAQADANMAYLRSMLGGQNPWEQLAAGGATN